MLNKFSKYNYVEIVLSKTAHSLKSVYGLNFLNFKSVLSFWNLQLFSYLSNRKNKYLWQYKSSYKNSYFIPYNNLFIFLSFLSSHYLFFEQFFFLNSFVYRGINLNISFLWSICFSLKIFDLSFFMFYLKSLLLLLITFYFSLIMKLFINLRLNFIKC